MCDEVSIKYRFQSLEEIYGQGADESCISGIPPGYFVDANVEVLAAGRPAHKEIAFSLYQFASDVEAWIDSNEQELLWSDFDGWDGKIFLYRVDRGIFVNVYLEDQVLNFTVKEKELRSFTSGVLESADIFWKRPLKNWRKR
ncbi:hypothetical protein [Microbulbifer sp. YPW1]|uniref:hypothetical protein n=1 Tax=Microbulbifer sp. YPW1 TaxID=2745199 RepID=UPI00159981D2|nr:hypothetical protein [Microbulbifer sp. YPW1]QKX17650.1 hypothetical protein HUW35_12005 [Microbulbifer sp. YPW1]